MKNGELYFLLFIVILYRVAAHWTPNSGDKTVLQYDDVMKLDFGTHIDGNCFLSLYCFVINPVLVIALFNL